ncbi:hypothetical protein F4809DRAFT_221767 [Biscogniauxia mediterranea]|nr:hypothetical protein F4809DRAFT_221767 [Biscogniauxia mediterranea]
MIMTQCKINDGRSSPQTKHVQPWAKRGEESCLSLLSAIWGATSTSNINDNTGQPRTGKKKRKIIQGETSRNAVSQSIVRSTKDCARRFLLCFPPQPVRLQHQYQVIRLSVDAGSIYQPCRSRFFFPGFFLLLLRFFLVHLCLCLCLSQARVSPWKRIDLITVWPGRGAGHTLSSSQVPSRTTWSLRFDNRWSVTSRIFCWRLPPTPVPRPREFPLCLCLDV